MWQQDTCKDTFWNTSLFYLQPTDTNTTSSFSAVHDVRLWWRPESIFWICGPVGRSCSRVHHWNGEDVPWCVTTSKWESKWECGSAAPPHHPFQTHSLLPSLIQLPIRMVHHLAVTPGVSQLLFVLRHAASTEQNGSHFGGRCHCCLNSWKPACHTIFLSTYHAPLRLNTSVMTARRRHWLGPLFRWSTNFKRHQSEQTRCQIGLQWQFRLDTFGFNFRQRKQWQWVGREGFPLKTSSSWLGRIPKSTLASKNYWSWVKSWGKREKLSTKLNTWTRGSETSCILKDRCSILAAGRLEFYSEQGGRLFDSSDIWLVFSWSRMAEEHGKKATFKSCILWSDTMAFLAGLDIWGEKMMDQAAVKYRDMWCPNDLARSTMFVFFLKTYKHNERSDQNFKSIPFLAIVWKRHQALITRNKLHLLGRGNSPLSYLLLFTIIWFEASASPECKMHKILDIYEMYQFHLTSSSVSLSESKLNTSWPPLLTAFTALIRFHTRLHNKRQTHVFC